MPNEKDNKVEENHKKQLDIVAKNGDTLLIRIARRRGYCLMSDGRKSPEMQVGAFL